MTKIEIRKMPEITGGNLTTPELIALDEQFKTNPERERSQDLERDDLRIAGDSRNNSKK